MAGSLSFDDKLLGEKTNYYCSSSEDEQSDHEETGEEKESSKTICGPKFIPEAEINNYQGYSTNTGPKGVINDWRRYKQLKAEERQEQVLERDELLKKLSLTCRSHMDDEKEKEKDEQLALELNMLEEIEDEFLKQYQKKRMEDMRKALENVPKFGKVIELTKDSYVDAIDKEKPQVTVIIHIYDQRQGCKAMNGCFQCLAQEYPIVKFCRIHAANATVSMKFAENALPAVLVYKNGEMVGNLIRVTDELGEDFFATDVESFLQENGLLPDKDLIPPTIKSSTRDEDSDSDFDID